jgi:hypothetical protein
MLARLLIASTWGPPRLWLKVQDVGGGCLAAACTLQKNCVLLRKCVYLFFNWFNLMFRMGVHLYLPSLRTGFFFSLSLALLWTESCNWSGNVDWGCLHQQKVHDFIATGEWRDVHIINLRDKKGHDSRSKTSLYLLVSMDREWIHVSIWRIDNVLNCRCNQWLSWSVHLCDCVW